MAFPRGPSRGAQIYPDRRSVRARVAVRLGFRDLAADRARDLGGGVLPRSGARHAARRRSDRRARRRAGDDDRARARARRDRSDEHTSELQSLMRTSYAGFCLKKKTQNNNTNQYKENRVANHYLEVKD